MVVIRPRADFDGEGTTEDEDAFFLGGSVDNREVNSVLIIKGLRDSIGTGTPELSCAVRCFFVSPHQTHTPRRFRFDESVGRDRGSVGHLGRPGNVGSSQMTRQPSNERDRQVKTQGKLTWSAHSPPRSA